MSECWSAVFRSPCSPSQTPTFCSGSIAAAASFESHQCLPIRMGTDDSLGPNLVNVLVGHQSRYRWYEIMVRKRRQCAALLKAVRAARRPRDAVQLVGLLRDAAGVGAVPAAAGDVPPAGRV